MQPLLAWPGTKLCYQTGAWRVKTTFLPPLPFALDREVVCSNPVTGKNFQMKFSIEIKADVLLRQAKSLTNFTISLPSHATCSCYLEPSFHSSFFLLNLKQVADAYMNTYRLSYLFPIVLTKPHLGNSQLECTLWVVKIPLSSICNYFSWLSPLGA